MLFPYSFRSTVLRLSSRARPNFFHALHKRGRWECTAEKSVEKLEVEIPSTCPGCGIGLQAELSQRPGYYRIPKSYTASPTENNQTLLCERCYSLRYYGRIKSEEAEDFVPKFSVESALLPKIEKVKGKRLVIVCVVDLFDFDASLPHTQLQSFFRKHRSASVELIVVGNKIDLLPKGLTKERTELWVRTRLKEYSVPTAKRVHLISSHTMQGVHELMVGLRSRLVKNTDCYIVGMQNAGKSSMLNALGRLVDAKVGQVTEAFVPGTTLDFVKIHGFPVAKSCRVYDTPGLLQVAQVTSRLSIDELKLVQPSRKLKPRTYRFGRGNSLLIGCLARLDLTSCPGTTIYATVWAADQLVTYLGKTDKVKSILQKHVGEKLQPPLNKPSDPESLPELLPQEIILSGDSWKGASVDICIAGLGWVAVGCKGEAKFTVWAWEEIQVMTRTALVKNYASVFQKPGFSETVT